MSRANVEVVRAGYEAQRRGDLDGMLSILDPEVELDMTRRVFDRAVYRGHEGFREFLRSQATAWSAQRLYPEQFVTSGDQVVVAIRLESIGRDSGVAVTGRTGHLWTLRDGKVIRFAVYQTFEEAREAGGVPEGGPLRN